MRQRMYDCKTSNCFSPLPRRRHVSYGHRAAKEELSYNAAAMGAEAVAGWRAGWSQVRTVEAFLNIT